MTTQTQLAAFAATQRPDVNIRKELVLVTPDKARGLLALNTQNRPLSKARIARYAEEMIQGRWVEASHQGIAIDECGLILDGQHRLHAVIKAGRAIWMFIEYGALRKTVGVLDDGDRRTLNDRFVLEGCVTREESRSFSAVIGAMYLYNRDRAQVYPKYGRLPYSRYSALEKRWGDSARFALSLAPNARAPMIPVVLSVIARADVHEAAPRDKLRLFADILKNANLANGDGSEEIVLKLNNSIFKTLHRHNSRSRNSSISRGALYHEIARRTEFALLAFINGETPEKPQQSRSNPWIVES